MKTLIKIMGPIIVGSLFLGGCVTATSEVRETKKEVVRNSEIEINKEEEYIGNSDKNLLIYDSDNCKLDYIDEKGILRAVTAVDGKLRYIDGGKPTYIDLNSTSIEIKK